MDPLTIVVQIVVFVFSIIVHENAHGVAANYFGDPTARMAGRITMNPLPHVDPVGSVLLPIMSAVSGIPFIGWAKPVPVNSANLRNPVVHNAYVAAAGPASNFLLAFCAALVWIAVRLTFKHIPGLMESGDRTLLFFDTICSNMIVINAILATFNLLPVPPLDGHWILMRFLPARQREALASVGRFGFLILIGLLWSGLLWRIIGPVFSTIVSGYYGMVNGVVRML